MRVPQSEVAAVAVSAPEAARDYIIRATETLRGALTMVDRGDYEGVVNHLTLADGLVGRAQVAAGRRAEAGRCRR
jgi:hypothetical protein